MKETGEMILGHGDELQAPRTMPCIEPMPPVKIMTRNSMETTMVNGCAELARKLRERAEKRQG